MSNNDRRWADNSGASYLSWSPKDNAEHHLRRLDKEMDQPPTTSDDFNFIGGPYVALSILPEEDEN